MTIFLLSGDLLDPVRPDLVLCKGHHRGDPAGRGSQRPRVVRGGRAAGLHDRGRFHVSSRQRLRTLQVRGSL